MHGSIHGECQKENEKRKQKGAKRLPRTSVVLLLLVIVAEFPLTLCRHPTLCLHHLFYFIGTTLETLGGVETGELGVGGNAGAVELADGVVTLGHGAGEASICRG